MSKVILAVLSAVAIVIIVPFGFTDTVDQQERGVILRNGAVIGVAQPGRGFRWPLIDSVVKIPVNHQTISWSGDEALSAYSRDQQAADITVSITFQIPADKVEEVYSEYGGVDGLSTSLIQRIAPQEVKTVFGQFNAATAIQERARMNRQIHDAIVNATRGPVQIVAVTVENIDFSEAYERSIEARMLEEVNVEKARQTALREKINADIAVTQAEGRARSALAEANAQSEGIRIRGEADAAAMRARGQALNDYPGLVALTAAERWDGKLPTSMIPNGTLPFVNLEASKR